MKTISIRDLHERTGAWVREAGNQPLQVTDRGRVIALIQAPQAPRQNGVQLPDRERWIKSLPKQKTDSTQIIGEDRDR